MKPLFDEVSVGVVDLTAQSESSNGSPVAELIDEQLSAQEIMVLSEAMEERSRRIGAVSIK